MTAVVGQSMQIPPGIAAGNIECAKIHILFRNTVHTIGAIIRFRVLPKNNYPVFLAIPALRCTQIVARTNHKPFEEGQL